MDRERRVLNPKLFPDLVSPRPLLVPNQVENKDQIEEGKKYVVVHTYGQVVETLIEATSAPYQDEYGSWIMNAKFLEQDQPLPRLNWLRIGLESYGVEPYISSVDGGEIWNKYNYILKLDEDKNPAE